MFSSVSPKRNLPYMLEEVNMKSSQREHRNIQVKRKKNGIFVKNCCVVCGGVRWKEEHELWEK